jgi:hypothetical protein
MTAITTNAGIKTKSIAPSVTATPRKTKKINAMRSDAAAKAARPISHARQPAMTVVLPCLSMTILATFSATGA